MAEVLALQSVTYAYLYPWAMTHVIETGATTPFFWRRFLVRVSYKSETGFIWYQIPVPIRTLFYSKPESGVHVTGMLIIAYVLVCFLDTF